MKLYLSSFKFGNDIKILKEWINTHNNKILLIANALDAKDEVKIKKNIADDTELLTEIGFDVKLVDLKEYFNSPDKLKKEFMEYNTYCVMGGNVFVLRQAMKLSGFDEFLKEISNNSEYLYIGYSAGSCVLSPDLTTLSLVDEPLNFYKCDEIIYEGLGLIDYLIVPHYKSTYHKAHLIDEIVDRCQNCNIPFKTLKDGDIIVRN